MPRPIIAFTLKMQVLLMRGDLLLYLSFSFYSVCNDMKMLIKKKCSVSIHISPGWLARGSVLDGAGHYTDTINQ